MGSGFSPSSTDRWQLSGGTFAQEDAPPAHSPATGSGLVGARPAPRAGLPAGTTLQSSRCDSVPRSLQSNREMDA